MTASRKEEYLNEKITSRLVWLGSRSREPEVGNTLSKLPHNVREWALDKLVWFCPSKDINGEAAIIRPGPVTMKRYAEGRSGGGGGFWLNMRVVYIAPHIFEKEDKFRHIIAHEIAHHWLGHSPESAEEVAAMEVEAEELAHKWLKTQPRKGDHHG